MKNKKEFPSTIKKMVAKQIKLYNYFPQLPVARRIAFFVIFSTFILLVVILMVTLLVVI